MSLTQEEIDILDKLTIVFNKFKYLKQQHSSDLPEFINAFHQLQRIIMVRPIRRQNLGIFNYEEEI